MDSHFLTRYRSTGLLILAALLALVGTALLRSVQFAWGALLLLAGAICFGSACKDHSVPEVPINLSRQDRFVRSSIEAWLGMTLVVIATLYSLNIGDSQVRGLEVVLLWLLGVILFSIGVLYATGWKALAWQDLKQKIRQNRNEILLVCGLVLAALLTRTIGLASAPYAVANDEGAIAYDAVRLLRGDFHNLFGTATAAYPILSYVPGALTTLVFGKTIFAMRVVSGIEGALSILFLYLLCRELFNRRVAWIASILLIALPVHIHFSRVGLNNILMCLHATLILWLLVRAIKNGRASSYLWAGLATGAALYAYSGSRLVMALAGGIVLALLIFKRGYLKANAQNVLIIGSAVLAVTLPQFAFFMKNPDLFAARSNAVGIFSSGWLFQEAARLGVPGWQIFFRQISEAAQVFISMHESIGFYAASRPFFSLAESALLVMGMGYAFSRIRHLRYLLLVVWFWAVVYFGGVVTVPATASQRFLPAIPAAVILIADTLDHGINILQREIRLPQGILKLTLGIMVGAIAVNGLVYYFYDYQVDGYYNRPYEEIEYETINIERQLGQKYRYVLIGAPRLFLEFGDYQYLLDGFDRSEIAEGQDLRSALLDQKRADLQRDDQWIELSNLPARPTFYAATPERVDELKAIAEIYPGGRWIEANRRNRPTEPLFFGYVVPGMSENLNKAVNTTTDHSSPWQTVLLVIFYLVAALILQYIFLPKIFRGKAAVIYAGRKARRERVKAWIRKLQEKLIRRSRQT